MALTREELMIALVVSFFIGVIHWAAHATFGVASAFGKAGVMEAGVVVLLGVLAAFIITDDD